MDGHWMTDTSGFYKYEDGNLLHGPNFVLNNEYTLFREDVAEYKSTNFLPIDGWYWFDSVEEAIAFFPKAQ